MGWGTVTSEIDLALICLYAFWIFFACLVFYLRREDRREGYPLESDTTGKIVNPGVIWVPTPKTFRLSSGETVFAPRDARDSRDIAARPVAPWPGAPLEPTGNPMLDGVGPAAYAQRQDVPDYTTEGHPKVVPMRAAEDFHIERRDPDPRGMTVLGGDGVVAGTISDVWLDRSEVLIRYLEVELLAPAGAEPAIPTRVLLPMSFCRVNKMAGRVVVRGMPAKLFADVPKLANPDQVTRLEEDKIAAYYAGGQFYSLPTRWETMI